MNKAGIWTTIWITAVCVTGGARLIGSNSHAGGAGSEPEEIAKAQRLGVPIDDAPNRTEPVRPDQNAAEIYTEIAAMMDARKGMKMNTAFVAPRTPVDSNTKKDFESDARVRTANDEALPALQPIFQVADELNARPQCQFGPEPDGSGQSKTTPSSAARSLVEYLCIRADSEDRKGDWHTAMKSLGLARRVSDDLGSRSGFSGLSSEISEWTTVRHEYEVMVQRHSNDPTFLKAAAAQVAGESPRPDLYKFVVSSVAESRHELPAINSFKDLQDGFGPQNSPGDVLTTALMNGPRLRQAVDARLLAAWIDLWPKLPKDHTDWQAYRRVLTQANDKALSDTSALEGLAQSQFSLNSSVIERVGEMKTSDRLLLDSIVILQMRIQNGQLPVILPTTLGSDRIDPFDGNPLRYRRVSTGFMLYSVGKDGVDHGGHKRQNTDPPGTQSDIVEAFS